MKFKKLTACVSAAAMISALLTPMTISHAKQTELTVNPASDVSDTNFHTIREAVAKAKTINPESEAERVTINVNPGDYEEQVRFDGMKFVTLQQTPGTEGRVNLSWYFCTGYCTSNTDLTGLYDPTIDWSKDETWNGYKDGDEKFTRYEIGQSLEGVSTISYYDTNGVAHKNAAVNSQLKNLGGLGWSYDKMAPLIVTRSSTDITIKDFNIINSVPVMVTKGEKDGHLTPEAGRMIGVDTSYGLPTRDGLTICNESTVPEMPSQDIFSSGTTIDKNKLKKYIDGGGTFTAAQSAWLVQSSAYNERGHAIATLGDRIIFENVRAIGNQDSIWASDGRAYFKNCDLLGGTDYIYGSGSVVFDGCTLGSVGYTDKGEGSKITTPNTDASRKYGYLFYNCTLYNYRENQEGTTTEFGGPWGADGQATFYNTVLDDTKSVGKATFKLNEKGWERFGAGNGLGRLYEYGTTNKSGAKVDTSKRVVNKSVEEGGTGMGTVLDDWQILEFNPRNYFSAANGGWTSDWDPMNFAKELTAVDEAIAKAEVNVPAGEETTVDLPAPSDGIEFHWESSSPNAVVTNDGKLSVIRPAYGEKPIESEITLYARKAGTTIGDKKVVKVTINPTTDQTNVFNIPVKINASAAMSADNNYTVTITKNSALIKQQVITLPSGENTVEKVIENIPASADGIDYDVTIVSASNDFTIVEPADGKTTVKGISGKDVELNITAQKLVDETIVLSESTTAKDGNKTYDLIALAKAAGASDDIESSDIISVKFDVDVAAKPSKDGFIDISSGTPSSANSATADRFTVAKINQSWTQIDTVDNKQGFSGSSNGDHQCLNITGKFDYSKTHTVTATINYKEQTVTVDGSNSGSGKTATPYTFKSFPENAQKGTLNMGVFPGSTSDDYKISNIKITYKKVINSDEPVVVPDGTGTYEFPGTRDFFDNGNLCNADDPSVYTFVGGVDEKVKAIFADSDSPDQIAAKFTDHHLNYIGGTSGSHPSISFTAAAGKYKVFYLGYNSDAKITATIDGVTATSELGSDFATNGSKTLKLYTFDIETAIDAVDKTITFDSPSPYLPDLYAVVIVGKADIDPSPTATPAPTPSPTPIPTPAPTPGGEVSGENMFVVDADTPTAAGTVYTDNNNIRVAGEFATAIGAVSATIEGKSFTHSLAVRVDGKDPDKGEYVEKSGTTPLHITAKTSGSFKIYYRRQCSNNTADSFVVADGKDIKLSKKNASGGYDAPVAGIWTLSESVNDGTYAFGTQVFTIEAGNEYLLWARGTTGTLLGYEFIPDGGEVTPTTPPVVDPTTPPTEAPTPTATTAPTDAPTPTATTQPTDAPTLDPTKRIVSAATDNGNTIVKLANIADGVLIGAAYDDGGVLTSIKFKDITGDDMTLEGIEADEVYVWDSLAGMKPVCDAKSTTTGGTETETPPTDEPPTPPTETPVCTTATPAPEPTATPSVEAAVVDFTKMSTVPVYTKENGQGFVSTSGAIMAEGYDRQVAATDKITVSASGASVTEGDGSYLANGKYKNSSSYANYGGLIYRLDTAPGAYHIEVTLGGSSTSSNTRVAPTGLEASRLTGTAAWDTAGHVAKAAPAAWNGKTWSFDFATGESFVEIDIEPNALPTSSAPQTVTVESIKITPIAIDEEGDKPTIHILGDSTQKTYTFNETISSWGQTLYNYFDLDKVNVVNYSMGGRCMRNNYTEGRFNDVLIRGKAGDFVFIHSAHNDESAAESRFDRGTNYTGGTAAQNNALYNRWLDMYVEAIKARGMTPVLVSPMTRGGGKAYTFNPDSPGNMRAKAASDPAVGYIELYQGSIDYYAKLEANEGTWTYNSIEAGETPANNAANGANGDGTHYREAAAKQFCRIMLQSIYDQSKASTDTYSDKDIMNELVSYMPGSVVSAAQSKNDWSAVFPEMASDVSAVDVVPGAVKQSSDNYYYRTAIEKVLQLGALHKDADNNFKPTAEITVGEFARGMETVFGLEENSLTSYTRTYAQLQADGAVPAKVSLAEVSKAEITETADYDADLTTTADGDLTITVNQVPGGTITVYNNSAFESGTGDVPANVTASSVFADNEYMTMTAPAELVAGSDKSGVFNGNSDVSINYIEFRNASPEKIVKYLSKADGIITVYARFNDNKAIELVGDGQTQSQTLPGEGTGATVYGTVQFNVKAGVEYNLYARGGTGRLYGVKYESNDYPQSTTTLAANEGDEIRVVAVPESGYLNDSILVNGEAVASGKEYTFKVSGNTTVSATYRTESEFVETTIIA
ncbi:MAG: S-layer homology domain-containing protein, partial [Oscillospiraceae bacterium]|nr:S-layer homology domain-containing protein [Oscillospiraceae bacterium]